MPDASADTLADIVRARHSARVPFDPDREIPGADLQRILECARWAPTAHNMQNFVAIVLDDPALLAKIGAIRAAPSETFLAENYWQLSFSEEELLRKGTGLLASQFPPAWRKPNAKPADAIEADELLANRSLQGCPTLLVMLYDGNRRAPASEGDVLGIMSLGCVMQNIWLMAQALGVGLQILSVFNTGAPAKALRLLLEIPDHMKIGFCCRLGYPVESPGNYLRVRRSPGQFIHHNRYSPPTPGI
ncbi:MAG TPA: nitroreductase family protein [Steroidobacteraceae bacterium]|nr:nitroreductase family protein [Steroidobacteraceae bacterium]